jgi:hypothetical protein
MDQFNSIVAFQKVQEADDRLIFPILNPRPSTTSSYERADKYYALSSLVSYVTLQSRYIVPPDISLFILGEPNSVSPHDGTFIGPSGEGKYVYEFPDLSSWNPPSSNKTQIINWEGYSPTNLNDPGIKWGASGEQTEFEDPENGLSESLNLPKVIKSKFMPLGDTPEFQGLSSRIDKIDTRIGKIEQFLSNFSTTNTITPQSNFYLGLSGDLSGVLETSGKWNYISNAGLWRQLV